MKLPRTAVNEMAQQRGLLLSDRVTSVLGQPAAEQLE